MVNAGIVNAHASHFFQPHFRESFRALGRFPRFKNPFKYTHNFPVNHNRPPHHTANRKNVFALSIAYTNTIAFNKTVTRMRYIVSI
jgi:hypothetical protein